MKMHPEIHGYNMSEKSLSKPAHGLRVVFGDETDDLPTTDGILGSDFELASTPLPRVTVNAGEVFELLEDAVRSNRAWLADFADDTIEVPQDLYEVLIAYKRLVYRKVA